VATGGAGGELRVWDSASREIASHMKHHTMPITDLKVGLARKGEYTSIQGCKQR